MSALPDKRVKFLFALYERRAKEAKSLKKAITRIARRVMPTRGIEEVTASALQVQNKVASSFTFSDYATQVSPREIREIREVVEAYALEICDIIGTHDGLNNALRITRRTNKFCRQWNDLVGNLNEKFLPGYGDVYASDLTLNKSTLFNVFGSLKKMRNVPELVKLLLDKEIEAAIGKSFEFAGTLYRTTGFRSQRC